MRALRNWKTDPPGGWYYICDCGAEIRVGNPFKLLRAIEDHMRVNEEQIPENLKEVVEDQICTRVPPEFCTGEDLAYPPPDYNKMTEGTKKLVNTGRKTENSKVRVSVAVERIPRCVSCAYNLNRMGCFKCSAPYKYANAWCKGLPIGADDMLRACDLLESVGLALVFSSDSLLIEVYGDSDTSRLPDNCWVKSVLAEKDKKDG